MRLAGVEAPRANHVAVYINNEYRGLYINVEHIDNDYFEARNTDDTGQLFKCLYGADFVYKGNNFSNYNKNVYSPENNQDAVDLSGLVSFISALDAKDDPDFRCELEAVFDVDSYLRILALEVLIGHWDNPVFNKNNTYFYDNPTTGKSQIIPYDLDNTYGIDWFGVDWASRNIYSWAPSSEPRPLYGNLLSIPAYKQRYGYLIKKYIETFFNPGFMNTYIDAVKSRIAPYVVNDTYAGLDYGYTYADFLSSYDNGLGGHVKMGLKEYISKRSGSAFAQLQNTAIVPFYDYHRAGFQDGSFTASLQVTAASAVNVEMNYRFSGGSWNKLTLKDDGLNHDDLAGDGRYQVVIPVANKGVLEYYYTAIDQQGKEGRLPFCGYLAADVGYGEVPQLFINEFMADNTSLKDEFGEYEDWIEIYNASEDFIYLGDKYLSDNPAAPSKWKLPEVDLPSHSFFVVWADEDQSQGINHANFKLSKGGEFIGIFDEAANNFAPIDTFSFGSCETNITYGKYPDGLGDIKRMNFVTPGKSNVISGTNDLQQSILKIFPNPAEQSIYLHAQADIHELQLLGADGRHKYAPITITANSATIETTLLPHGMYFVQLITGSKIQCASFIKQ
ncbi:MAG: CotH kinase family protein [Saprospiraceae bacterium]|nr:CotH kinase family protein [Saprospiraceae bacterium]